MPKIYQFAWRRQQALPTRGKLPCAFDGRQEARWLLLRLPMALVLGAAAGVVLWQWQHYRHPEPVVIPPSPITVSDMHYVFPQRPFPPQILPPAIFPPPQMTAPAGPRAIQNDTQPDDQSNNNPPPSATDDLRQRVEQALREQSAGVPNLTAAPN